MNTLKQWKKFNVHFLEELPANSIQCIVFNCFKLIYDDKDDQMFVFFTNIDQDNL